MSDALRRNSGTQRLLPNEYSRQLQAICGGHALWAPRKVENGGGSLGDAGYISQGSFYKEFNVYEDPPSSTTPLPRPTVGVYEDEQFNMPIMQSSQESRIELRLKGSSDVVPLPLAVAPLSVEPSVVLHREKLAFLVPPKPARRDSLNRARQDEFCDWLSVNRHKIREDTILVTQAVRSSGWVGGVVTGRRIEVTGDVTADVAGVARMSVGASTALETVQMARIQGPDDWTQDADANYTLIINFTMARSRMERLMHRLKVQISDLGRTDSPTPAKAAGPNAAPKRESKAGRDAQIESQLEILPVDALSHFDEPLSMAPETATSLSDWDDVPAHNAGTSDDEDDMTLLKMILDEVLADNVDVDVAIADSSIIAEFYEHAFRSGSHESPPTYLMNPVVTKRTIVSESRTGPRIEMMAFVESIQLKADSKQLTTGPVFPESTQLRVQKSSTPDANSSDWYSTLEPMLKKMLKWSRYSDARCNDVLTFFASNMVQFLGPVPTPRPSRYGDNDSTLATRRWHSFVNPDNTPLSLSLAWGAARPAPRTRLAIDIIPTITTDADVDATCKRSIEFALALRQYTDDRNTVAITNLDLQPFAVANQLLPMLFASRSPTDAVDPGAMAQSSAPPASPSPPALISQSPRTPPHHSGSLGPRTMRTVTLGAVTTVGLAALAPLTVAGTRVACDGAFNLTLAVAAVRHAAVSVHEQSRCVKHNKKLFFQVGDKAVALFNALVAAEGAMPLADVITNAERIMRLFGDTRDQLHRTESASRIRLPHGKKNADELQLILNEAELILEQLKLLGSSDLTLSTLVPRVQPVNTLPAKATVLDSIELVLETTMYASDSLPPLKTAAQTALQLLRRFKSYHNNVAEIEVVMQLVVDMLIGIRGDTVRHAAASDTLMESAVGLLEVVRGTLHELQELEAASGVQQTLSVPTVSAILAGARVKINAIRDYQKSKAHEIVADLVSRPYLPFFGFDIKESETKVQAYFIPGLAVRFQDEDDLVTMSRTFMSLIPADASERSTLGAFNAWREIVSSFSTLAEEDIPLPFMLSVDCVPRLDARYRVYFRCVSRSPEELQRLMSLNGRVQLSPRHMQGVIDLWDMLRPRADLLRSQSVLSAYGLCISYEFKESSPLPTATVYFPVQQWASNDLKIAVVITRWLEKYGHPEAAATYVHIASDICAPCRLVESSGFHTYVGVAPTEDGGCEATTYYNPGLFRQGSSFASGSTG